LLVVTVKKLLKSVHIYRSYSQNKPGGPFLLEHPVYIAAQLLRKDVQRSMLRIFHVTEKER